MIRKWLYRVGAACVLCSLAVPAVRADEIDPILFKETSVLLKALRNYGYKNVGVLKFEVQRGGDKGAVSMSNGNLNSMMATRLENALILANEDANPIGITRNASEVAAKRDKNAGYHTKAARAKLFEGAYPLAWGSNSVMVDVFLTGRITITPDYKKSIVLITMFDKKNPTKLVEAVRFEAPVDRSLIVDLGQPFAVSKAVIAKRALLISPNPGGDTGSPTSTTEDMVLEDVQKSAKSADEDRNRPARPVANFNPGQNTNPPVPDPGLQPVIPAGGPRVQVQAPRPALAAAKAELDSVLKFDVYYNDQLVAWTTDNRLPNPNEGDRIEFRVRANERIGMILRVNGVNTADYDRTPKMINDYSMWVLEPGKDYAIRGFYTNDNKVVLFTAKSPNDVDPAAELGDERRIGKIDLDVLREMPNFAGGGNPGNSPAIANRGIDLRGTSTADNVSLLKGKLRTLASRKVNVVGKRPIIVGGAEEDTNVATATFRGVHAIHMPITYFDPRAETNTFLSPENE